MDDILAATLVMALGLTIAVFRVKGEVIACYLYAVLMVLGAVAFVLVGLLVNDLEGGLVYGVLMLADAVIAAVMGFMNAPARPWCRRISS